MVLIYFSASEPRISKELFGYYLMQKLNIQKRDLRTMKTYRDVIKISDIILPYVKFTSADFNLLLERFKSLEVDGNNLKGSFKYSVNYKRGTNTFWY